MTVCCDIRLLIRISNDLSETRTASLCVVYVHTDFNVFDEAVSLTHITKGPCNV